MCCDTRSPRGMVQILGFSGDSTDRPRASTVEVLSVAGPIAGSGTLEAVQGPGPEFVAETLRDNVVNYVCRDRVVHAERRCAGVCSLTRGNLAARHADGARLVDESGKSGTRAARQLPDPDHPWRHRHLFHSLPRRPQTDPPHHLGGQSPGIRSATRRTPLTGLQPGRSKHRS